MALIDLKTDLKSLSYGDQKPLITKSISNPPAGSSTSIQVNHRVDDLVRISKLLTTKPGLSYLANEALLKQSEIGTGQLRQQNKTLVGAILTQLGDTVLSTVKLVGSTLAQVPVNGTGTHFVRKFGGRAGYLEGLAAHELALRGTQIPLDNFRRNSNLKDGSGDPISFSYTPIEPSTDTYNSNITYLQSKKITKESKYKLGQQLTGQKGGSILSKTPKEALDIVNFSNPSTTLDKETSDLIKFNFQVFTADDATGTGVYLRFRAYLDSFDDDFSANWNPIQYIGRGENFYTYGGFSRSINLSFKIAASTRDEMKPLYKKIVWLASTTAPTYNASGTFMRGSFVKLTVGDYLNSMPGIINNVKYSWRTDYPWETNFNEGEVSQQLPHVLDCSVSFTPIHNFIPETGYKHFITSDEKTVRYFESGDKPADKEVNFITPPTEAQVQNLNRFNGVESFDTLGSGF